MNSSMERCRVVLVRPTIAANVGAVARVMRNFGLSDLRLVAPHADPQSAEARKLSTHGESILHGARRHGELGEAVAECVWVVGSSARTGGRFRTHSFGPPRALIPQLVSANGPVALVFGPEPSGLTNAEIARCHQVIAIPADDAYPALNLAQAVAICLYELRLASETPPPANPIHTIASFAAQEHLFIHLEDALRAIHFLYGDNADALMAALRHLIGRAQPTQIELDLLHGVARQMLWCSPSQPPISDGAAGG